MQPEPIDIRVGDDEVTHVVTIACTIVQLRGLSFTEAMARAMNAWVSMKADFQQPGGVAIPDYPHYERVAAHNDEGGFLLRFLPKGNSDEKEDDPGA
jgi:hypothetical protein